MDQTWLINILRRALLFFGKTLWKIADIWIIDICHWILWLKSSIGAFLVSLDTYWIGHNWVLVFDHSTLLNGVNLLYIICGNEEYCFTILGQFRNLGNYNRFPLRRYLTWFQNSFLPFNAYSIFCRGSLESLE